MEVVHTCSANTYDDVRIVFDKINIEEKAWLCEQTWHAIKHEIGDSLSSEVGTGISFHYLLITYCPFCGVNLNTL